MLKRKKKATSGKKENWLILIRRKFFFISALAISAVLLSNQIVLTQDFRSGSSVLGEENSTDRVRPTGTSNESQTEMANGIKVHSKVEDNGSRHIEGRSKGIKFNFQVENGRAKLEAEDVEGNKINTETAKSKELEQELENEGVNVSSSDGEFSFGKGETHAVTHFPLSVDPDSHELTVTTPAGTKTVTVLPDEAVNNFLKHDQIPASTGALPTSTPSGGFGRFMGGSGKEIKSVDLALKNNELVYDVQAQENKKLFGILPVTTTTTTSVSAEDGTVVSKRESLFNRLVGLLSF